ncbi:helix-turn-helix transcriptional regulator [Raoultibacter massiliensis]|uniref:LuxR C-terminal-related transcriptional regulator n=1 Tax=Raoultibacter massiliensis TaxID=1852371 RepID=A0ABV1J8J4_9ACTN|nr:LuxR C-terminal-related transcriptional regulator [Raoultibacter massiliensis]
MASKLGLHVKGKTVFSIRWLGAAFAFAWAWLAVFGNQSVFYPPGAKLSLFIGFALALLALRFAPGAMQSLSDKVVVPLACSVLTLVTFVLCAATVWSLIDVDWITLSLSMGLAGFCLALIVRCWMGLYATRKTDAMTIAILMALIFSAVLYYVLWIVKPLYWGIGWMAFPPCCLVAFYLCTPRDSCEVSSRIVVEALVMQRRGLRARIVLLGSVFLAAGFCYGVLDATSEASFAFSPIGMGLVNLAAVFVLWMIFSRKSGSTIIQYVCLGLLAIFAVLFVVGGAGTDIAMSIIMGAVISLALFLAMVLCIDVSVTFGADLGVMCGRVGLSSVVCLVGGCGIAFAASVQSVVSLPLFVLVFIFVVTLFALGAILLCSPTWIAYELSDGASDELESTIIEDIKRGFSASIEPGIEQDIPVAGGDEVDVRQLSNRVEEIARLYDFSPRQTEIFTYLTRGHKADFIANKLFISPNTVRTHTANIYRKLEIHTHQELLNFFYGE